MRKGRVSFDGDTVLMSSTFNKKEFFSSWFYSNCNRQRRLKAKICNECPFRDGIEDLEKQVGG
jgi:hypothetical protein